MLYTTFYAVPSGAPTINQAIVISPTEVEVSWFEVDPIHQNGIITVYEVDYQPLNDFGSGIVRIQIWMKIIIQNLPCLDDYLLLC